MKILIERTVDQIRKDKQDWEDRVNKKKRAAG